MIGLNGIQIEEKVGDLDVIYSGTIFSFDANHPAKIVIGGTLTITIEFKQDEKKGIAAMNFHGDGSQMYVTCYNFSNVLGNGTNPVRVGELNSKELWMSFIVTSYNPESHLFHYALYYGKTIQINRGNYVKGNFDVNSRPDGEFDYVGEINQKIGTGDNAKDAIAYLCLKWSFALLAIILLLLSVYSAIMIYKEKEESFVDNLLKGCGIITPIITLLLGYIFANKINKTNH